MSESCEPHKQKPSDKITSLDNMDKDTVKKRNLLEAKTSCQASVEVEEDDRCESDFTSLHPKNPHNILESDDEDSSDGVIMLDRDPSQPATPRTDNEDVKEKTDEDKNVTTEMVDKWDLGNVK